MSERQRVLAVAPASDRPLTLERGTGTPPPAKKVGEIAADRKRVRPSVLSLFVVSSWLHGSDPAGARSVVDRSLTCRVACTVLWCQAAGKYEELKQSGSPEFNVFFRKVGATDEDGAVKGGWYPVGSLACPSSQEIGRAIFSTEDAFLQGAYRIHGKQIKKEFKKRDGGAVTNWKEMKECDVEYGWQFKVSHLLISFPCCPITDACFFAFTRLAFREHECSVELLRFVNRQARV